MPALTRLKDTQPEAVRRLDHPVPPKGTQSSLPRSRNKACIFHNGSVQEVQLGTAPSSDTQREQAAPGKWGCSTESSNSICPIARHQCSHEPLVPCSAAVSCKGNCVFFPSWPGNREWLGITHLCKMKTVFRQYSFVQGLYMSAVHGLISNMIPDGKKPELAWQKRAVDVWSALSVTEQG